MADRIDVGTIRRAQIVDAACRVIQHKGIQGASLAEIEQEAGVSRGMLTYHFPSKERIILAVFDATLARIKEGSAALGPAGWTRLESALEFLLTRKPVGEDFDFLQYTFLAQMSHREDFRTRLAAEFAEIRGRIIEDVADLARRGGVGADETAAVAAVVHGALSGLIMQTNADPGAVDRERVFRVLRAMVLGFLSRGGTAGVRTAPTPAESPEDEGG